MATGHTGKGATDPILRGIDQIRQRVTYWRMGWGYLCLLLLVLGMLFGGVLLDHLVTFQRFGRLAFFHTYVASVAAAVLLATGYPLVRRVGRLFVARRIEEQNPDLSNSLISYLQVREDPQIPTEAKMIMGRRVEASVRAFEPEQVIDYRPYLRVGVMLLVVVAVSILYSLLSPKSVLVSAARLLSPRSDILPPTATRVREVTPGPVYAVAGDRPSVSVRLEGVRPDTVAIMWDGRSFKDRRILLSEGDDGVWRGRFPPVLEHGSYYVRAGDTRSERYDVRALPRPVVEEMELRVEPPDYTGLAPETVEAGDLEVVKGTRIRLKARTSLEPAGGHVSFASGRRVPLDRLPEGSGLGGEFTAMRSDTWSVRFESVGFPGGAVFRNSGPVEHRLNVLEDRAPTVRLVAPPDGKTVPRDAVVRILYSAEDDFGLTEVRLHHRAGGIDGRPVVIARPRARRVDRAEWEWDLSKLPLRPGQTVTYHLEAADNRPEVPQTGRSEVRRLLIADEPRPDADRPPAPEDADAPEDEPPDQEPPDEPAEPAEQAQKDEPASPEPEREAAPAEQDRTETREERLERLREYVQRLKEELGMPVETEDGVEELAREPGEAPERPDREDHPTGEDQVAESVPDHAETDPDARPADALRPGEEADAPGVEEVTDAPPAAAEDGPEGVGREQPAAPQQEIGEPGPGDETGEDGIPADGVGTAESPATPQEDGDDGFPAGPGTQGEGPETTFLPGEAPGTGPEAAGAGVRELPEPGADHAPLTGPEMEGAVQELEQLLGADDPPDDLLDELDIRREDLRDLIEHFRERQAEHEATEPDRPETQAPEPEGRILRGVPAAAEGVTVRDAMPAAEPDELRSRFDGADEQLSTRYREVVNQYYRAITEER